MMRCWHFYRLLIYAHLVQIVHSQFSGCWFTFSSSAGCSSSSCISLDEFSLLSSGNTVTCDSAITGSSTWILLSDGTVSNSGGCTVNSALDQINGTLRGGDIEWTNGYTSRQRDSCNPPPPPSDICLTSTSVCNNAARDCCAPFPERMECVDGYTAVATNTVCNDQIGAAYACCTNGATRLASSCLGSTVAVSLLLA